MKRNTLMFRLTKPVLVMLAIIFFVACSKTEETPVSNPNYLTETDYKVLQIPMLPISSYILVMENVGTEFSIPVIDSLGIDAAVVEQYNALNKKHCVFKSNWINVVVVNQAQIEADGGLQACLQKNGASVLFTFGRPVYYQNNTMAAFMLIYENGPWMGGGDVVVAEKVNGEWVLKAQIAYMISK